MPIEEDIGLAYQTYMTHSYSDDSSASPPEPNSPVRRLLTLAKQAYIARRFKYGTPPCTITGRLLGALAYLNVYQRPWIDHRFLHLPVQSRGRLLDIGCGEGELLKGMQEVGWEAEGVDFDAAAVEAARSRGLSVRLGTLHDQQYPDDQFDAITLSHTIEHVHDPLVLLRECHRVLKPEGQLLLITPNNRSLAHRIFGSSWITLDPPRHLQIFSPCSLRTLTARAGFRRIHTRTGIRAAEVVLLGSRSIQQTGRYVYGSMHTRGSKILARSGQLLEYALTLLGSGAGEEIILRATK
jgi:SAM-dependent methyltransferase